MQALGVHDKSPYKDEQVVHYVYAQISISNALLLVLFVIEHSVFKTKNLR